MAENQYEETYVDNDMEGRAEERKHENVHAYKSLDVDEPVGTQRAMPPPRPTNSSQQIESKRDEKTTNGLKYLTIAFVVTTVLFAGMLIAIFVLVMTPSGEQGIAEDTTGFQTKTDEKFGQIVEQINKMNESFSKSIEDFTDFTTDLKRIEGRSLFLEKQMSNLMHSINGMPSLLSQGIKRTDEKFGQIVKQINKMNETFSQSIEGVKEELACLSEVGGIAYNGSCLWAEEAPARMTLEVALQTCNRRTPSKLPEVYGEKEYLKIIGYLRSKLNGKSNMHAWTSMRRNITTGEALLSDGSVAPYTKPRTNATLWKKADATKTHVYLLARPDPNHTDQGMGAKLPTYDFAPDLKVVLCQKI